VTVRTAQQPGFSSVVSQTYRSALVDDGTQLSVLDFPAGIAPTETKLATSTTGGGGWNEIGYDNNNFYVYRSLGTGAGTTWQVLRVTRTAPSASLLASGAGELTLASMGRAQLYTTIVGTTSNSLLAVSKTPNVPPTTIESTPSSTLTSVQTSSAGVHELWRISGIGTASVGYVVEMIDETGTKLYSSGAGGFPISVIEPSTVAFTNSESRSRFLFVSGYGSRAFGDATLIGYDAAAKTVTTYGTLPGTADFGADFVFATAQGGPQAFSAGMAARSVAGSVQQTGTKVFSFDAGVSGSLKFTTAAQ
jgi:hypothetical protein